MAQTSAVSWTPLTNPPINSTKHTYVLSLAQARLRGKYVCLPARLVPGDHTTANAIAVAVAAINAVEMVGATHAGIMATLRQNVFVFGAKNRTQRRWAGSLCLSSSAERVERRGDSDRRELRMTLLEI